MTSKTFCLQSRPYLNTFTGCYSNVITVNTEPAGPLREWTRRVAFAPLSPFQTFRACVPAEPCALVLAPLPFAAAVCCGNGNGKCHQPMTVDAIPDLFSWLLSHGYTIDTSVTQMMHMSDIAPKAANGHKLIAFVTYRE